MKQFRQIMSAKFAFNAADEATREGLIRLAVHATNRIAQTSGAEGDADGALLYLALDERGEEILGYGTTDTAHQALEGRNGHVVAAGRGPRGDLSQLWVPVETQTPGVAGTTTQMTNCLELGTPALLADRYAARAYLTALDAADAPGVSIRVTIEGTVQPLKELTVAVMGAHNHEVFIDSPGHSSFQAGGKCGPLFHGQGEYDLITPSGTWSILRFMG